MKQALIIVDYQYDFANPNGKLYVDGGETLKTYLESLAKSFKANGNLVIATKDDHPIDHYSFQEWGQHCLKDSLGAELYFESSNVDFIVNKGTDKNAESYSAFYDENKISNGLHEYLSKNKIKKITIVGLALEICVQATVNDAIKLGYETTIDFDGTKGLKGSTLTIYK